MPVCPICARPVLPRAENKAFPFCSSRCRQVDLGGWLDEKYRVSGADSDGAVDGASLNDEDGE